VINKCVLFLDIARRREILRAVPRPFKAQRVHAQQHAALEPVGGNLVLGESIRNAGNNFHLLYPTPAPDGPRKPWNLEVEPGDQGNQPAGWQTQSFGVVQPTQRH